MNEQIKKIQDVNAAVRRTTLDGFEFASFQSAITSFTISPIESNKTNTVAVASATFYDALTVNGITINEGKNGLYVKMPQKRTQTGNYIDVCHPLTPETRREINRTLTEAFKRGELHREISPAAQSSVKLSAQNCVKYDPRKYGKTTARLDLTVNDMVVHNCKLIRGLNDNLSLYMPNYKDKSGTYHSLVTPHNSEVSKQMSKAAVIEFNTEYKYMKASGEEVAKLGASGVDFQTRTNAGGENIVKFKTTDADKINKALTKPAAAVRR